jgi:hypothetical protein
MTRTLLTLIAIAQLVVPAQAKPRTKPAKPDPPAAQLLPKPDDSLAPARLDPLLLQRTYDRARAKRNIGIGLASPGVALTVLGGVAIAFAAYDPNLLSKATELIAGGSAGVVGLVLGIPGLYLWTTGQDDMDVAIWRRRQLPAP